MSAKKFPANDPLLTPDNHAVLLIDHQYLQLLTVRSHSNDTVVNNATFLAKAAKVFNIPTLLTTAFAERQDLILEVQAVHFNADQPYIFTSGWASPVYIDCRKLISYPRVRRALMEMAETTILRDVGYEQIDAVAGAPDRCPRRPEAGRRLRSAS